MATDSSPRRAPDFLGIGLQKAATTWLHGQLQQHHDLWLPHRKELHFFDMLGHDDQTFIREAVIYKHLKRLARSLPTAAPDVVPETLAEMQFWIHMAQADKDVGWYAKIWSDFAPSTSIAGEITPAYSILDRKTIELTRSIGVRKVLIMLRDPVARTWSHTRMAIAKRPRLGADHAIRQDVLERGRIQAILENWESVYPAEDICIGFVDELATAEGAAGLLNRFVSHVGAVPATFDATMEPILVSEPLDLPDDVRSELVEAYQDDLEYCADRFGSYCTIWKDRYLS